MADLDPELLERAVRWCADAGRQAGLDEIRRALAPLTWDELLAVRALLAAPPPARPLGPHALVDLARGAPSDVAAEREREGRYSREDEAAQPPSSAPPPSRRRGGARRGAGIVIRRARDRAPPAPPAPPSLPDLADLSRPEGRGVLERLVRRHGARRAPILAALAAGWRGPEGAPPGGQDLAALLDHHGLAHAFERRERDEVLHALRAAGGVRLLAAERLGLDVPALDAALSRLGAAREAEQIREERRSELRSRATLAERVRLLLAEEPRLRDLELLDEVEGDLRARLPEHLRALRAGDEPLGAALARSLSATRTAVEGLAARFGLDLGAPPAAPGGAGRPRHAGRPPRRAVQGGAGPGRPLGERRPTPGTGRRSSGGAWAGPRPGAPRPGGSRPGGPRPGGPRPGGPRPGGPRPGGPRPGGPRPGGPRPGGPRPGGPRPGGPRPSGPRPRPAGSRGPRGRTR